MTDSTTSWAYSSYWGSFWGQSLIELFIGALSAFIFLFLVLWLFKPKVEIAPFLCQGTLPEGGAFYTFKFVNKSFFSAHEVIVELHQIRKLPMGNGDMNNEHSTLTLVNSEISHIPRRLFFKDKMNLHCVTVRSLDDINQILTPATNAIMLRISLKHGLTGLSNVFEKEYAGTNVIKTGRFKPGKIFEVI